MANKGPIRQELERTLLGGDEAIRRLFVCRGLMRFERSLKESYFGVEEK